MKRSAKQLSVGILLIRENQESVFFHFSCAKYRHYHFTAITIVINDLDWPIIIIIISISSIQILLSKSNYS